MRSSAAPAWLHLALRGAEAACKVAVKLGSNRRLCGHLKEAEGSWVMYRSVIVIVLGDIQDGGCVGTINGRSYFVPDMA